MRSRFTARDRRNPDDPGLYERLAEFLNQNKMAAGIEQVYTKAAQQFQDPIVAS